MALYGYIERKEDVLDLMIDAVYGEVTLPLQQDPRGWRSNLQEIAVQTRAVMHRHPWFASLIGHRAVLGPNALKQTNDHPGTLHIIAGHNCSLALLFEKKERGILFRIIRNYLQVFSKRGIVA